MTHTDHNRRSEKPGRREEDYTTCPFHEGTCSDIQNLERTMMPRWIMIGIGGPVIALILAFTGWTAIKSIGTAEHLVKVEVSQAAKMEAMQVNIGKLMEHFNLVPVTPKEIKNEGTKRP